MKYEFGRRLRKYREKMNLSQKEFAQTLGVSNSRVSNWEQGINRPDVDLLAVICKILNVNPNELLDVKLLEEDLSEEEKQIIIEYRQKTDMRSAVKILLGVS